MPPIEATTDRILSEANRCQRAGLAVDEVRLGDSELQDFREWADYHYSPMVDRAIESRMGFYWHGLNLQPACANRGLAFVTHRV